MITSVGRAAASWLSIALLTCFAPLALAQAELSAADKERAVTRLGVAAKLLASSVFVSGRDPDRAIEEDFKSSPVYARLDWSAVKVDLDRAKGRLTLSMPGAGSRTAIFTGKDAQGVVLLPVGETALRFTPKTIPRNVPAADAPWPMGNKLDAAARPRGIDEEALTKAVATLFDDSEDSRKQRNRALVVVHKGQLVTEQYAPGFNKDQPLIGWSMGKTVVAALLGITSSWEPKLDLNAPAPIPQWHQKDDPRAKITLADLMQMSGGLSCPSHGIDDPEYSTPRNCHNSPYYGIVDAYATMLARPQGEDPPGTRWRYRNSNTLALAEIVRARVTARSLDYLSFPQQALFDRIGARSFVLETDLVGNFIISGFNYATARDWARFGEFLRRDGVAFDGSRVLPAGWVDFMRKPAKALKEPYYGGQVWLNAGAFPTMPKDTYYARGSMEQLTIVVPSRETVFVRLGATPDEKTMFELYPYLDKILTAVLAALPPSPAEPASKVAGAD